MDCICIKRSSLLLCKRKEKFNSNGRYLIHKRAVKCPGKNTVRSVQKITIIVDFLFNNSIIENV